MSTGAAPDRFAHRGVIVTGGSRGIGRAIALRFAGEGARVAIGCHRGVADAEKVAAEIGEAGGEAHVFQGDVTLEADVQRLVRFAVQRLGTVDVLVSNAGTVRDQLLALMTVEQWDTVIETNLRGSFLCIREVLPIMIRAHSGSIVCISSVAATKAGRGHANYVASKGGINAMVRSLAVELAPKGIRVNAVSPGVILTDMTERVRDAAGNEILNEIPLGRFGDPEDVAAAVTFLASDDARYITGEILHVTGGFGL